MCCDWVVKREILHDYNKECFCGLMCIEAAQFKCVLLSTQPMFMSCVDDIYVKKVKEY